MFCQPTICPWSPAWLPVLSAQSLTAETTLLLLALFFLFGYSSNYSHTQILLKLLVKKGTTLCDERHLNWASRSWLLRNWTLRGSLRPWAKLVKNMADYKKNELSNGTNNNSFNQYSNAIDWSTVIQPTFPFCERWTSSAQHWGHQRSELLKFDGRSR